MKNLWSNYRDKIKLCYAMIYLLLLFLMQIPMTLKVVRVVVPFCLPVGFLILALDLWFKKIHLFEKPYNIILVFYCSYFITIIMNFRYNIFSNIKTMLWFATLILVIGCISRSLNYDKFLKYIKIIFIEFLLLTFIASAISIFLYICQIKFNYILGNSILKQGFFDNRLFGVYREPNASAGFALISVVMSCYLFSTLKRKQNILLKVLLIINFVIQFIYFVLTNSRGGMVTACFAIVYLALYLLIRYNKDRKNFSKRIKLYAVILVLLISLFPAIKLTKVVLEKIPAVHYKIVNEYKDSTETIKEPEHLNVDLDRTPYAGTDISTGRIPAWILSIKTMIKTNPLFGVGDRNIGLYVLQQNPHSKSIATTGVTSSCVVRLLVSSGFIGLAIFIILAINYLKTIIRLLFKEKLSKKNINLVFATFMIASLLFINSIFLEDLFLCTTISSFVFWGCIGCAYYISDKGLKNEKKDVAFFAATPLQILNCIQINKTQFDEKKCDLYILDFAVNNKNIFDRISELSVFENVYYLKEPFNNRGRFKFFKSYLNPDMETIKLLKSKYYDQIFSTCINFANDYYYTFLKINNNNLIFNYYEEGIGDYTTNIQKKRTTIIKLVSMFGYENPISENINVWLYHPEYMQLNKGYNVREIPLITDEEKGFESIFDNEDKIKISIPNDCKIIYFDQPYKKQQDIDINNINILAEISKVVNKNNIYIKLHPANNDGKYIDNGYKVLDNNGIPWEVYCNDKSLSDVVLISINSTASVSPKMIYNKEPKVILLYKLFDEQLKNIINQNDKLFSDVKNSYCVKKNFIIPESIEDLRCDLQEL